MPKLPKKKTMLETIARVQGYAYKLYHADKLTSQKYVKINDQLIILKRTIEK